MKNRVLNAIKEYEAQEWTNTPCNFNAQDVEEVKQISVDLADAIIKGLLAGFAIGDMFAQDKEIMCAGSEEGSRIEQAYNTYKNYAFKGAEGAFYSIDIENIHDSYKDQEETIIHALMAGALIGFRHGNKKTRKDK